MHVCTALGDYSESYLSRHSPGVIDVQRKIADTVASVDRIVCLNEGEINFFRKYFPGADAKLSRIVNGYQPPAAAPGSKSRKELGLPDKGFLFGMVGRGVEKKGWKQAIDAFMLAGLPSAYLVLVGGGEYLRELATKVIDDRIIFTGETPAPLKYIAHFDVGLMPTLFEQESLPTVIMEYLYCGKPVIATNVGDIRKMLTDDSTGEMAGALVDREKLLTGGDTLVLLMRKFVEEPAFRKQKESAAPGAFVKFDMEACADAYLRLYGGT
jgi:glycosyltransferase involved in cell wall biosynthesis